MVNGHFWREPALCVELDSEGRRIVYMRAHFAGESVLDGSDIPIALAWLDGGPADLGPSAEQVADRYIRQANLGLAFVEDAELPDDPRDSFFYVLNRTMIPRDYSVPLAVQPALEALLSARDILSAG